MKSGHVASSNVYNRIRLKNISLGQLGHYFQVIIFVHSSLSGLERTSMPSSCTAFALKWIYNAKGVIIRIAGRPKDNLRILVSI